MQVTLSAREARRLTLSRQGLLGKAPFGKGKNGVRKAVERLGYIQIDTISVINRAHHHTLWTRVPGYQQDQLERLVSREKSIFEYWSHAAAYLPMTAYRYSLPRKLKISGGVTHWYKKDEELASLMAQVLDRIKREGPLQARDFEAPEGFKATEMWSWKPAKKALEQLFIEGKLMISRREKFQKVFDIPQRVLPEEVATHPPSEEEFARHLITSTLSAHGFATLPEIVYLRRGIKPMVGDTLKQMLSNREVVEVRVKGIPDVYFALPEVVEEMPSRLGSKRLHLLSPFDNLVIQRKRVEKLFGFEYQIECYVPGPKRKYGYFCLPILLGDRFIGRMDPKADRKKGIFYVKSLHFEEGFRPTPAERDLLAQKVEELAAFNGCTSIEWP